MHHATEELTLIREWLKETKADPVASGRRPVQKPSLEPIAITGVSGFFPGCEDVATFWKHLDRDESLITPIPWDRFDPAAEPKSPAGRERARQAGWGGFIPDVASFDPDVFKILPLEAEEMDPRQRLLLMSTWRTLEDASLDPRSLVKSNTGVFVACEGNEYAVLMSRAGFTPKMGFGQANSMVANRISYHFDFSGPSEMVDATCAGFAVALHRAVVALRAGLIDRAIVGAANLILLPDPFAFLSEAGQLSTRNTVKSFGRDGDGFLRAEGVGTILIERREDAVSAGRRIYAEIKHTAVNFNGRGGVSMASPNTDAHAELIKACYREAGIDPRDLSYIEAQGMGSPVADIAEWAAVNRALTELCKEQGLRTEPGFCRVSTLKPMLGHMHSASSLGALLKVIRSFQTGKIHKVLDYTEPNEYCDMRGTPCRIATETEGWETAGRPRLAAIHAYGSGGNNAHVLLAEAGENRRGATDARTKLSGYAFKRQRYWFQPEAAGTLPESSGKDADVLPFIRQALQAEAKGFDQDAPFAELGLDSLSIAAFVSRLESEFRVSLRKSDIFSHATPARLAAYVSSLTQAGRSPVQASQRTRPKETDHDDIAIIGMSLQVAGAENPADFWKLLREGRSAISAIPPERAVGSEAPLKNVKGGWVSDVDTFDPLFFKISPKESASMDPRHRKLLQAAWAAIEDSGHSPDEWKGAAHGVFIGIEESDYPYNDQSAITAVHAGTAPARIGYLLDVKGPVLAISTACSSSLVAVHAACRSILDGESDCALAGGCNLISQPGRSFYALAQMGSMLSPDGTCYAFDRRANGMVLGEGVGLVVLKRLSHALRDRDPVYAVIKGSGINYDGKTNGLTAPSGARQRELYERVYRQSGIEPARISYVVAHGTGTSLGDPVECNALIDAFGANPQGKPWCALTSPKTNIGHTQAASGIVNLITAALALKNGEIPPSLNFNDANGDIALGASPFYVNTALKPWNEPERYAAVSSFGHTGTNAHVLLGSAADNGAPAVSGQPVLIVLSAKSEERLRQAAKNLFDCPVCTLADLAYTLQVGREAMDERLGMVVKTIDELRTKLGGFLASGDDLNGVYRGQVKRRDADMRKSIKDWVAEGKHDEVLKWWVDGGPVDWARFYGANSPRRIHLPTYPFEKERYWLKNESVFTAPKDAADQVLAPETDAAMEVMTFKEEWVASAPVAPNVTTLQTLVCVLAESATESAWRDGLHRVAPQARWIFVSKDAQGGYKAAFQGVREAQASLDAVIYLPPFAAPQRILDASVLLPILRALASSQLTPGRLVLVCPFSNDLERCSMDAWVAYERSLKPVFPQTKATVVGLRVERMNAGTAMKFGAETLWAELHSADGRSALYENGQRHLLRIEPATLSPAEQPLKRGGTYLITGGCGGLGLLCAEHLAKNYSAKLILTGRTAPDEKKTARLDAIKRLGGEAVYVQADVGDPDEMKAALAEAGKRLGSVNGVIHAAGVEGSRSILEKDIEVFQAVIHPKIQGTLALDEALCGEPLDFIAYFSSSAAVLGDFGSCDYAIANRFQTAYARYRNGLSKRGERTGKATVINWPLWKQGGMGAPEDAHTRFYLATSGQRALETSEGMALFEQLLGQKTAQHLVLAGKPDRVHRFLGLNGSSPITSAERKSGVGRKPEMRGFSLEECLQWDLKKLVGALLNIEQRKLKLETNLADFGFDSISLADFAERLGAHYGLKITPALFFGHSTIQRLTRYFLDEHLAAVEPFYAQERESENTVRPQPAPPKQPAVSAGAGSLAEEVRQGRDEPIAVIGMSGRFPQARTIDEMWKILSEGRDAVEEIPADRFDWREFYGDPALDKKKSNGKWMGCLPGVAEFDPLFFEISPREAETMDPRQRHLLQESWKALEDAGYGPRQIANHKVGVFVGVEEGDYALLAPEGDLTANSSAILASRLAYLLDFRGPVLAINTACSSGLVAAHQACSSLRNLECDAALVAGVSLQLTPAGHIAMGQSGMLSDDGKCFVFDKRANGMVPGEAAVALVLKRLSQAEADGDPIHAVIRASGVNYDGKTNGITAPSGVAQAELLASVYEKAHLDPGAIEYIVAHGTGTRLGDPVEVNALHRAFKDASPKRGYCALTSTKGNFGHTFAASGLVGAVSLVEALRHEEIPASLHCEEENDYITWEDSPFYVNKRKKAWPKRSGKKRLGAVSAFGMSGTNVHMVFEEYVLARREEAAAPCYLLVLSAKTEEALRDKIGAMTDALRKKEVQAEGLARVSYTLFEGRHHFQYRMAVVVQNGEDAILALEKAKAGETGIHCWRGRAPQEFTGQKATRKHAEALLAQSRSLLEEPESYRDTLCALAELYCQGYALSWQPLFGETPLRRIGLPAYPFARETYWVEKKGEASASRVTARLHPLVHANTSDFHGQRFSSTFTGTEFFLADHRIKGELILPGVAYLEMARAALALSVPADEPEGIIALSNIVWVSPLAVSDAPREVHIGLREGEARIEFEVFFAADDGSLVTYAKGGASHEELNEPAALDLAALRGRMTHGRLDPVQCYAAFLAAGVDYGAAYQGLRDVLLGGDEVLARIVLPESVHGSAGHYVLHPSLLDSAFQATLGLGLSVKRDSAPRIPFALEQLKCFDSLPEEVWVWARHSSRSTAGNEMGAFDLDIADEAGRVLVEMRGFSTRAAPIPGREKKSLAIPRILNGEEFYLRDHGALLPGVVSLEWARAAGRLALGRAVHGLKNVVWNQPLTLDGASREVQTALTPSGEAYAYHVSAGEMLHAQGIVVGAESPEVEGLPLPIAEIRSRCPLSMTEREHEALINARLGPSMRSIAGFHYNGNEALAVLALPSGMKDTADEFILHPSLLNGAIQACNILARIEDREGSVPTPFSLDELRIHRAIPAEAYAYVKKSAEPFQAAAGSRLRKYDLLLTNRSGEIAVSITGYASVSSKQVAKEEDTLFAVPCWNEQEATAPTLRETAATIFILAEESAGLREALLKKWPGARIEALPRLGAHRANDVESNFGQVFQLIQNCLQTESKLRQPVLFLTSDSGETAFVAACAGLFRTARIEQARIETKIIRYAPVLTASMDGLVAFLEAELGQSSSGDVEIRLSKAGKREVRSIREAALGAAPLNTKERAGGVIWITGGLGGLGRAFARHYAVERKACVFLSGRSPLNGVKRAFLHELQTQGGDVRYLQGDVAHLDDVKSMVKSILWAAGDLNGIIHSAGVIEDGYIFDKRPEAMGRVWRPKVAGVLALDEATRDMDLDFLALFSSLTGTFGNAGQSDYAGANAFLDSFAEERNRMVTAGRRRGRTVSVAWPLWRDGGMGMDAQSEILLKQRSGMSPMETAQGIAAFQQALHGEHAHVLVLHGDTAKIRVKLFPSGEKASPPPAASKTDVNAAGLSSDQVQAELRRIVAAQQKIAPEKIEPDGELLQYGFDSIRLTELANRLNKTFSLELMPTLFFEHTTLRAIARYLIEKHSQALTAKFSRGHAATVSPDLSEARPAGRRRSPRWRQDQAPVAPAVPPPIAIVGISGRFPGSANVDAFWRHLEANHDLISEVPADRWNWREHYGDPAEQPGKTKVKSAGFMTGIDQFDPAFFGISPREAISMDPQFRVLLETVWAAIEDAGYRAGELSGSKTGVFVGISTSDYKDAWLRKIEEDPAKDGPLLVSHFVVANRISYILNLHGPSEPIDTACSSSLIAIHRAIEAMRQGNCEQAIVGGVNVISNPDIIIGASRAGMLSEDGRCKTFDKGADGYGRGEGVGALLLKPLDVALRDGDHIYALVRGSAENHGGRAHSPTAPNPAAQRDLLVSAYTRASVDPRTVGYIEAHGTGTSLGDPIEIDGLKGAFEALYQKAGVPVGARHCGLGSVKTNVGHLEAAAGIAGILKVVMMLRHKKIPGNVHLHEPNPYLQLEGTPFYLVRETQDWAAQLDERQQPLPRRAGVSSFGIGGSNAHVILEEYAPEAPGTVANDALPGTQIVVLSAKKEDRLKELAKNLRDFLKASTAVPRPTLREVACTLQTGREAMEERLGFVVASLEELTEKLSDFVDGEGGRNGLHRGRVSREGKGASVPAMADWLKQGEHVRLLEQWVQGADLDWRELWTDTKPLRTSLPTYPFARNRYWFEAGKNGVANGAIKAVNGIKPPVAPAPSAHPKEAIEAFLVSSLAKILYLEEEGIARDSSFIDIGLDSVLAVEWIQSIKGKYGIKVPATKVYDYPTVSALRDFLAEALNPRSAASVEKTPVAALSLDEILEQVRNKRLGIEEAERLIDGLGLDNVADEN